MSNIAWCAVAAVPHTRIQIQTQISDITITTTTTCEQKLLAECRSTRGKPAPCKACIEQHKDGVKGCTVAEEEAFCKAPPPNPSPPPAPPPSPPPPPPPSPPTPGPATCEAELKSTCGPDRASVPQCHACVEQHAADLKAAGCTAEEEKTFCPPPPSPPPPHPPSPHPSPPPAPPPSPPKPPADGCEKELVEVCGKDEGNTTKCRECLRVREMPFWVAFFLLLTASPLSLNVLSLLCIQYYFS